MDLKGIYLNKRQKRLIKRFIEQDQKNIATRRYQKLFKVSYGTARSDLNELSENGLVQKKEGGAKGSFIQPVLNHFYPDHGYSEATNSIILARFASSRLSGNPPVLMLVQSLRCAARIWACSLTEKTLGIRYK